jgi:hypothetical protein
MTGAGYADSAITIEMVQLRRTDVVLAVNRDAILCQPYCFRRARSSSARRASSRSFGLMRVSCSA